MLIFRERKGRPSQFAALDSLPSSVWVGRQGHPRMAFLPLLCVPRALLAQTDFSFIEENDWWMAKDAAEGRKEAQACCPGN